MSALTRFGLLRAGLRHYRRAHAGVAVGAMVGAAVLVGALLVGDSVRHSLRELALARIGQAGSALASGDRLFRTALADGIERELGGSPMAALLRLDAVASASGGGRRANGVVAHGVDGRFFAFAPEAYTGPLPGPDEVLLNERLAAQLDASAGDTIVLRVQKPSALTRDMVLATTEDAAFALRVEVKGVLGDAAFGRFSLEGGQIAPFAAFVDLAWMQSELELGERANVLLAGNGVSPAELDAALAARFELEDAQLEVVASGDGAELRTERVFLDDTVVGIAAELARERPVTGVLTYFVNELRSGERAVPYSMVTALGTLGPGAAPLVPADLEVDEIVVNEWLAADMELEVGAPLEVRYFVPSEDRTLQEMTSFFRVRAIVPIEGFAADRTLMPDFPGLSDSEHCRDWETGIPVDLGTIRTEDEEYWEQHKGTPKAFVSLVAGRSMWSSRFGSLTAVRFGGDAADFRRALTAKLDPASLGLYFADVRSPALDGSRSATDFGGLFLGLSFFLILSAILLTTLLFVLGVEQRSAEAGLLLAVGYRPREVRRLLFREAALVAAVGTAVGAGLGTLYTRGVLRGLTTVWSGAIARTNLSYHATPGALIGGAVGAFLIALASIAWALRKQVRHSPLELLQTTEGVAPEAPAVAPRVKRISLALGAALLFVGVLLGLFIDPVPGPQAAGAFFVAGAVFLVGGVVCSRWMIAHFGRRRPKPPASVAALGFRSGARRPGRSLATLTLLACGTFLVVSIGVNHKSGTAAADMRGSGTGGFALFARSTLPVHDDLNSERGREAFALDRAELMGVDVVAMRARDGDDASCLNLGTPVAPRLLGVDPELLESRGAFTFAGGEGRGDGWSALTIAPLADEVPGFADASSVRWTMHKKIGDTIEYTDERGRPFRVRIERTLNDSVLQGNLVISEEAFRARFPSQSGYRTFLVDAPPAGAESAAAALTRALEDVGLEVTPAARRLDEFNAVQNTYLAIFQVLGGLGVLLGSVGLGVVVLRNALERRRELAVLRAVGFSSGALRKLLFSEHALILALGLASGTTAALLALAPTQEGRASLAGALLLTGLIAINACVWIFGAATAAVRGTLIDALRNE